MKLGVEYEITTCAPEFVQDMYDELVEGFYKTAVVIRDKAINLVPVGNLAAHPKKANPNVHLRDTIRAGRSKKKNVLGKALQFLSESRAYYKDDPAAFVFAGKRADRVYWAHWVEFGTYFEPAHPFMRPAMNSSFNKLIAETERYGRRAINKRRRQRKWGKGHA